jgi:hypothetical protein
VLTRTARVYFNKLASGAFSLVREKHKEHPPCGISYLPSDEARPESGKAYGLYGNKAKFADDIDAMLVCKIQSLIANMQMFSSQFGFSAFTALTTCLSARNLSLRTPDTILKPVPQSRVRDDAAVREAGKVLHAYIDTHLLSRIRKSDWVYFGHKKHEPSTGVSLNSRSLYFSDHCAVEFDFNVSCASNKKLAARKKSASTWVLRKRDAAIPFSGTVARKSRMLAALHAFVESLKRPIESPEDILCALSVSQAYQSLFAHLRELVLLVVQFDLFVACFPRIVTLLESAIVKVARFAELSIQESGLRFRGVEAIFETAVHDIRQREPLAPSRHRALASRTLLCASIFSYSPLVEACWI